MWFSSEIANNQPSITTKKKKNERKNNNSKSRKFQTCDGVTFDYLEKLVIFSISYTLLSSISFLSFFYFFSIRQQWK